MIGSTTPFPGASMGRSWDDGDNRVGQCLLLATNPRPRPPPRTSGVEGKPEVLGDFGHECLILTLFQTTWKAAADGDY